MKRNHNSTDKSTVYRNYSITKITAPNSLTKDEPRGSKTVGKGDLRGGRA